MSFKHLFIVLPILILTLAHQVSAASEHRHFHRNPGQYSKPLAINSHIRIMSYSPNETHNYVGYYGYAANILFEDGEEITTISMGDPTAWQITPAGNRLFIKPLLDNPETNAMIITNRRIYYFILHAKEATGLYDSDLVFETRFVYPSANLSSFNGGSSNVSYIPDINEAENLNFDYIVSGNEHITPIRVFDDGKFTYMQFTPVGTIMPAVFFVEDDGYESIVNIRTEGKTLIVEKLGSLFTLRYDKEHACVFNKKNPYNFAKAKEAAKKDKKKKKCKNPK